MSAGPVNQRFGGRIAGSLPVVPGQEWRLNADVTAILSAEHFKLLPRIEAEFCSDTGATKHRSGANCDTARASSWSAEIY